MTVAKKAKPKPKPAILRSFRLTGVLAEIFGNECKNSDVIRTIMAVTAIQRLMSEKDNGKFIFFSLA